MWREELGAEITFFFIIAQKFIFFLLKAFLFMFPVLH